MKQTVPLLLCLSAVGYVNGVPTTSQLDNGYVNPPADKRQLFGGAAPTVTIANPSATIVGSVDSFLGIIPGKIESFKGIPFAQPPVGQLRLKPPMPLTAPLSTIQATNPLPPACPQFLLPDANITGLPGAALNLILSSPIFRNGAVQGQEDCLTVNVQRPAGTTRNSKLPVLLWIFGGGFELGSTLMYDASGLVGNSMALGKPIVFVAVNYRVGGFGFLPGKEILQDGSANLGLLDQRMAMQWVADNIAEFGGDPDQVTLWGESAGAISVYSQMLMFDGNITYKGKPLFRAGIMDSGSFVPTDPVDTAKGQQVYNTVVQNAGCAGKPDTLGCLRSVDFQTLVAATNSVPGILSFNSVALSYLPRPDGKVITQSPDLLIVQDKVAKVPFIIGDQEDEGTLFALFQSNLSTTADVEQYLASIFFKNASPQQISALVATYPDDPAAGSPFGTGADNNWYPQFKRLAALLGDATFTLVRRATLLGTSVVSKTSQTWSYLATYGHGTPIMGTFHATDILQVFYGLPDNTPRKMIQQYYFNFVYNMDPNNGTGGVASNEAVAVPNWTPWAQGQMIMNFSGNGATLMPDNFRQKSFEFLVQNVAALRF